MEGEAKNREEYEITPEDRAAISGLYDELKERLALEKEEKKERVEAPAQEESELQAREEKGEEAPKTRADLALALRETEENRARIYAKQAELVGKERIGENIQSEKFTDEERRQLGVLGALLDQENKQEEALRRLARENYLMRDDDITQLFKLEEEYRTLIESGKSKKGEKILDEITRLREDSIITLDDMDKYNSLKNKERAGKALSQDEQWEMDYMRKWSIGSIDEKHARGRLARILRRAQKEIKDFRDNPNSKKALLAALAVLGAIGAGAAAGVAAKSGVFEGGEDEDPEKKINDFFNQAENVIEEQEITSEELKKAQDALELGSGITTSGPEEIKEVHLAERGEAEEQGVGAEKREGDLVASSDTEKILLTHKLIKEAQGFAERPDKPEVARVLLDEDFQNMRVDGGKKIGALRAGEQIEYYDIFKTLESAGMLDSAKGFDATDAEKVVLAKRLNDAFPNFLTRLDAKGALDTLLNPAFQKMLAEEEVPPDNFSEQLDYYEAFNELQGRGALDTPPGFDEKDMEKTIITRVLMDSYEDFAQWNDFNEVLDTLTDPEFKQLMEKEGVKSPDEQLGYSDVFRLLETKGLLDSSPGFDGEDGAKTILAKNLIDYDKNILDRPDIADILSVLLDEDFQNMKVDGGTADKLNIKKQLELYEAYRASR